MTRSQQGAGASRPGRRRARNFGLFAIGLALLATLRHGIAGSEDRSWDVAATGFDRSDVEIATQLLREVRGANDIVCAAIDRAFNSGYWGESIVQSIDPSLTAGASETARWIGKRHIASETLTPIAAALNGDDACSRRIAARIAGNLDVRRLDRGLQAELTSERASTRHAAVLALGYAEQDSSLDALRAMLGDSDRSVRLAALWAIGRLEKPETQPLFINLLDRDPDPDVRRIAAWALGQLDH